MAKRRHGMAASWRQRPTHSVAAHAVASGRSLDIHIYRMPNTGWTLEVVDDQNTSTVWDGEFATDQEALDTALADINAEGIEAFIARPPDPHSRWA